VWDLKEAGAPGRVGAELVSETAKGSEGIAEACGDLRRRAILQEVGAESFVVAVPRGIGRGEELGGLEVRQVIIGSDRHSAKMLGARRAAGKQQAEQHGWQEKHCKYRVIGRLIRADPDKAGRPVQ
jgi:hypothetical protein